MTFSITQYLSQRKNNPHWCQLIAIALAIAMPLSCRAQSLQWRDEQFGTHRLFGMTYDLWRQRLVLFSAGRTLEWDGEALARRVTSHSPDSRFGQRMTYDTERHTVLMFGGNGANTHPNDLWEYDGNDWQSHTPGLRPAGRTQFAMTYDLMRRRCIVFGGVSGSGYLLNDTFEWNGTTWQDRSGVGPAPRSGCAMAYHLATGQSVLFGGADNSRIRNDTWVWNGTTWSERFPPILPPARAGHSMSSDLLQCRVMMFGGTDAVLWQWNGTLWSQGPSLPVARTLCEIASGESGQTFLMGGQQYISGFDSKSLGDLWRCDGNHWQQQKPTELPPRGTLAAAFDATRNCVVAVGPSEGLSQPMRMWELRASGWLEKAAQLEPEGLNFTRLCYDQRSGSCVMFGGMAGFLPTNYTYEWSDGKWRILSTQNPPPPRFDHSLVYDNLRQQMILFGGRTLGSTLQDTWLWNGASWSLAATSGPSARSGHGMAFDSRRGRGVLFGGGIFQGTQAGLSNSDTWEWDGSTWLRVATTVSPPRRASFAMAYDERRGLAVIVSGNAGQTVLQDCWEYDGKNWRGGVADAPRAPMQQMVYDSNAGRLLVLVPTMAGNLLGSTAVQIATTQVAEARVEGNGCGGDLAPKLQPFGVPLLGRAGFRIDVVNAAPQQPVLLGIAAVTEPITIGTNCQFYLQHGSGSRQMITDPTGFASLRVAIPNSRALLGLEASFQAGMIDPTAALGVALTASVHARIGD
jgi:hypothetical protein